MLLACRKCAIHCTSPTTKGDQSNVSADKAVCFSTRLDRSLYVNPLRWFLRKYISFHFFALNTVLKPEDQGRVDSLFHSIEAVTDKNFPKSE